MPAKVKSNQTIDQDNELEQLKQLLFDKELQSVEELRKHLLDPQQRSIDIAEILANAIKIALADKQDLVEALNDPVDECIRSSVTQKPQQFADSLFPVMGPAIRKSISEALKSFVQSTNQMVEQSMSPKSLRWRWEAKRSGVPFSEIVLKYSLLYRVEEVFLIQQGTGLLIEHVSHPDVLVNDSDAISAMLTVIRDFSRDSFSTEANDSLQTVEFGERTLWIFDGPKALLACVNRGLVPKANRDQFQSVLEQFHALYSPELGQFSGDRSQHPEFHELLKTCLTQQSKALENSTESPPEKRHWLRKPTSWILLFILLLSGYWFWNRYDELRRTNALLAELKSMAGVVVFGIEESGDAVLIKGLRDPQTPVLDSLADKYGFSNDEILFQMALYQSLDPPMALKRAEHIMDIPDTVSLTAQDQQLLVSGTASQQWIDFAIKLRDRIPGFKSVSFEQISADNASRLLLIRQQLQVPQTVQLGLDNDNLMLAGTAPAVWVNNLKQKSSLLFPELNLINNQLLADEWLQAIALRQQLDGSSFYFSEGITFNAAQQSRLQNQLKRVIRLLKLLDALNTDVEFVITGYADGIGDVAYNQVLKLKRAEVIKQNLLQLGVKPETISIIAGKTAAGIDQADISLRRVDLQLSALK